MNDQKTDVVMIRAIGNKILATVNGAEWLLNEFTYDHSEEPPEGTSTAIAIAILQAMSQPSVVCWAVEGPAGLEGMDGIPIFYDEKSEADEFVQNEDEGDYKAVQVEMRIRR